MDELRQIRTLAIATLAGVALLFCIEGCKFVGRLAEEGRDARERLLESGEES